jgi:leucyl aminopeptidase
MHFSAKTAAPERLRTACLVVGIHEEGFLTPTAGVAGKAMGGALKRILARGDFKGRTGQTALIHDPAGMACERLLLVGCGKKEPLTDATFRKILQGAFAALKGVNGKDAALALTELPVKGRDAAWKARQIVEAAGHATYIYTETRTEKKDEKALLDRFTLLTAGTAESRDAGRGIDEGLAIAAGVSLAKTLGNLPGNICTPTYLADQARGVSRRQRKVKVSVLTEREMQKLKMGALLSVARGSRQPPRLIVMEYRGAGARVKPVVLVGKGLTFDAGGISLKPPADMDQMKYDMCGGASVIAALQAAAQLQLPINVVGIVPASENLPDGNANKPGDIVTSMSGQTVEILNTDAEGRLILSDALTYAKRFNPEVVIDVATLTGACVIALGKHASGLLGNDQDLIDDLLAAGQASGDRAWQLPLWDEYQDQLKSPFADMANVGGRDAGTITGACFLSRYAKDFKWAHLDIAGTAWIPAGEKGATGRPVPMLVQYLLDKTR